MKKLVFLILLVMTYCGQVKAQVLIAIIFGDKLNTDKLEFGLVVSPSFTNITNIESEYKSGLNLSLYFNVKISDRFFIHPEAIAKGTFGARYILPYSTGSDTLDSQFAEGSIERKIKAFGLMILGQYRITEKFYAEFGPQVNWMLKSKDTGRSCSLAVPRLTACSTGRATRSSSSTNASANANSTASPGKTGANFSRFGLRR